MNTLNNTLEDTVLSVVHSFMSNETLFTALDVSNEVKKTIPTARHKDVRNMIRSIYGEIIEPAGWSRTEIDVTLDDGSAVPALLYHPLSESWNLDELYGDQKRMQVSVKPPADNESSVNDYPIVHTTIFNPNSPLFADTSSQRTLVQTTVIPQAPATVTTENQANRVSSKSEFIEELVRLGKDLIKEGRKEVEETMVEKVAPKFSNLLNKLFPSR